MQELELALTKIHLSFDLWTSPNRHAMMAIIAHFIDNHKRQQTRLLALRRQLGAHSGENLAVTLVDVVSSWGIVNKVGTVICDNASNNDSCLRAFYLQLDPSMELKDIKARRMRCYGHILNLVARAFLFGKDADSFELQSEAHELLGQQEADLHHWRQQGPIGKLHNIIKFIRASPQRSERFKKRAQETETEEYRLYEESTAELELIQNNETRWNSTYLMIQRAFTKRAEITAYFIELEHNPTDHDHLAAEDNLTIDDWRLLGEIMHLLKPLYDQTMRTQGWGRGDGHGRLWEVMTGIEYLLEHLEDWKTFYDEATTETAAQAASQVVPGPLSPPLSQQVLLPPSTPSTQVSARSVRAHQLPAQLNGCEVNTLLRGSRSHQQRHQQARDQFNEAALPEHTRGDFTTSLRHSARTTSSRDALSADHRTYFRASINNAWSKLDSYYAKLGDSPLFAAAIILHPRFSLAYLENNWNSDMQLGWAREAQRGLRDYYNRWYRDAVIPEETQQVQNHQEATYEESEYTQWINSRRATADDAGNELDRYYRLEPQNTHNVIQWWIDHQAAFPTLSRLALDIFAIPAMATDCERAFSLAKLSLTSQRQRMSPDTLEALQCLKNWSRHGNLGLGGVFLKPVE
jgi:hypothetical protein